MKCNKIIINVTGLLLLLVWVVLWIGVGYLGWSFILILGAYTCFSINDGGIRKLRNLSINKIALIVVLFILSIALLFSFIQLANYIINHVLHLNGWFKTLCEVIAIILFLYPIKFALGSVVYHFTKDIHDQRKIGYDYEAISNEAKALLEHSTDIETIKALRKKHRLSLLDAKKVVDDIRKL